MFLLQRMQMNQNQMLADKNAGEETDISVERVGGSIFLSDSFEEWEYERNRKGTLINFLAPGILHSLKDGDSDLVSCHLSLRLETYWIDG